MPNKQTQEAAQHLDVISESDKLITQVSSMDVSTLLQQWVIPYGIKILVAIAIFVIGKRVARFISKVLGKLALKSTKDGMIESFVASISYFFFLLVIVIAALSQLGIDTSSLVALIGAAGLAIGLSLQSSLQNFAAGVLLLIFKPFHKGNLIEVAGQLGRVEKMGLLMLELRTLDNKTVLIPNAKAFGDNIVNFDANETRRVDLIFEISYSSNIGTAKAVLERLIQENKHILREPAPTIAVSELGAHSVKLVVRPWVKKEDYWAVYYDMTEQVKLEFDKAGIEIPFHQMNVHFAKDAILPKQ